MDMSLSKLQELVLDREAWRAVSMGLQRVGQDWATDLNWWLIANDVFVVDAQQLDSGT